MPRDSVFDRVVARMSAPSFYAPAPSAVEVRETHISIVFLAGERAYKVKKPVRMPFVDYSTLEQRRRFCAEEVRLNRRFAPDVYLGVASIVEAGGDLALADGIEEDALEYVVVMRRFDDRATLEHQVERRLVDEELAARVGARVAELHLAAPRAPAGYWTPAYIEERLAENFETTRPDVGVVVDRLTFDAVQRFSYAFLRARTPLLEQRIEAGMVRDLHGDLRAEHIVIEDDRLSIIDCIEFDERLRLIDVAADLAFLIMDLERLGAHSLAAAAERAYLARTRDPDLRTLLPFYCCYSEWVRAKVTAGRVRQLPESHPIRSQLEQRARSLFALSLRLAWRARLPLVVVLCGVAGTGKSTLAGELAQRSGLSHVSSDRVRKALAGLAAGERGGPELYTPDMTARTYGELAARAGAALAAGGGAILDATFLRRDQRALLREVGGRVLWVECTAPEEVLRRRGQTRERAPERGSDATWTVVAAQLEAWEPLDDVPAADRHVLRTDRAVEECLDELDSFVSAAVDSAARNRQDSVLG
jgi:aminoglycoside phosphotransferase family enzyme/shikimate kinase